MEHTDVVLPAAVGRVWSGRAPGPEGGRRNARAANNGSPSVVKDVVNRETAQHDSRPNCENKVVTNYN